MSDFLDREAFEELSERVHDALEALGLTVMDFHSTIHPETGDLVILTASLVRPTAFKNVTADLETRKAVQRMAADEAQTALDSKSAKYAKAIEEGRILDVLTGKASLVDCGHKHDNGTSAVHEGLCLLCQEEVTND